MLFRLLADVTVVVHGLFILFVVLGGFLTWRWPRLAWVHLPCAVWGAAIAAVGWTCPLTPLELALRRQAGEAGHRGGFIEHYLIPLMYPGWLTPLIGILLGAGVVVVTTVAYLGLARRRRGRAA